MGYKELTCDYIGGACFYIASGIGHHPRISTGCLPNPSNWSYRSLIFGLNSMDLRNLLLSLLKISWCSLSVVGAILSKMSFSATDVASSAPNFTLT